MSREAVGETTKAINIDRALIFSALLFIIFPVICFLWGWTKPIIAVCGTICLMFLFIRTYQSLKDEFTVSITEDRKFWCIALASISIWCLFSGIGGFSYQAIDFMARNPIFRDLCSQSWPIRFDLAEQPELIRNLFPGATTCDLVYYYAWWLPVAGLVKVFHLSHDVADALLLVYTVLYVFLIFYCLSNIIKKKSYVMLSALIFFGGFDFWVSVLEGFPSLMTKDFPLPMIPLDIEWWANRFSYSSNTAQLFNVFNSSLPIWMLVCLLILLPGNRIRAALGSLAFAYSPFGTVAMVFIVLTDFIGKKNNKFGERIKEIFTPENLIIPIMMLVVFGGFYLRVNFGKTSTDGLIFKVYPEKRTFTLFIIFLLVEVWVYFLAIGKRAQECKFYWVTLIGLSLIPLWKVGAANDWSLKVSVPLLFLLMIMMVDSYYRAKQKKQRYIILAVLIMGFMTSAMEFKRNIHGTLNIPEAEYIHSEYNTFKYLGSDSEDRDSFFGGQYLVPEKEGFWLKYIGVLSR